MAEGAGAAGSVQVSVPAVVTDEFKALKTRRKYRYITLKIDPTTFTLAVDKTGAPSETGADFIKALPKTQARFAIFDYQYKTKDGRNTDKLFAILWTPKEGGGKDKMLYTSQRRSLDASFTGVEDAQCSTVAELGKLLSVASVLEDEEDEWDPDA